MSGVEGRKPRVSRAVRKKSMKKFAVGDRVTWGIKFSSHPVVAVTQDGLYVRVENHVGGYSNPRHFVAWSDNPEKVQ